MKHFFFLSLLLVLEPSFTMILGNKNLTQNSKRYLMRNNGRHNRQDNRQKRTSEIPTSKRLVSSQFTHSSWDDTFNSKRPSFMDNYLDKEYRDMRKELMAMRENPYVFGNNVHVIDNRKKK